MRRIIFLFLLALSVTGLMLVGGCSDDDNGTNPVVKEVGDTNDPVFQSALELTDNVDMWTQEMFDFISHMVDTVFSNPAHPTVGSDTRNEHKSIFASSDSVTLTYHSNTNYWMLYYSMVDTYNYANDTVVETIVINDSIQFRHGGTPVQWPDSALLTGVTNGISVSITTSNSSGALTAGQLLSLEGQDIFSVGDVTINGNQNLNLQFSDSSASTHCAYGVNFSTIMNNILMNVHEGGGDCPDGGMIVHSGNMSIVCTGDTNISINDGWTITGTFHGDGTSTTVFENSTTRWEVTDSCGNNPPSVMPLGRLSEKMQ